MKYDRLIRAYQEAIDFCRYAEELRDAMKSEAEAEAKRAKKDVASCLAGINSAHFPALSGATKRASMDLTRVLAELRRSPYQEKKIKQRAAEK